VTNPIIHHRKKVIADLGGAIGVLGATAAFAAITIGLPFVGTVTGEDLTASARFDGVTSRSGNNPACVFSVTPERALRLDATNIGRPPAETACRTNASVLNTGETALYVAGFEVTTTRGTASPSVALADCGKMIAPNASADVGLQVILGGGQAGTSGTLGGRVTLTDTPPASCPTF